MSNSPEPEGYRDCGTHCKFLDSEQITFNDLRRWVRRDIHHRKGFYITAPEYSLSGFTVVTSINEDKNSRYGVGGDSGVRWGYADNIKDAIKRYVNGTLEQSRGGRRS